MKIEPEFSRPPRTRFPSLTVGLLLCGLLPLAAAAPVDPSSLAEKKSLVELMTRITGNFIRNNPLAPGEYRRGDWEEVMKSRLPKTCYWSYTGGVSLLAVQRVFAITGDERIPRFIRENNEISADQYSYLRWQQKTFGKISQNAGFGKLWRLSMLDDCGAMGAEMLETKLRGGATFTPAENELIDIIGEYVTKKQSRLPDGAFWRPESPDGPTIWADDLFMGVPFLIRWSEDRKDPAALDDAARQIIAHASRLQDRDGVWFHAYFVNEQRPNGIKWGRANGWVAVATAELLSALPADHPRRAQVLDIFHRQMDGLRRLQSPSGLWQQVLDHPELTWGLETSCSAQFAYAMARGLNRGWLDNSFREVVNRAIAALCGQITADGRITNVCPSTSIGRNLDYYNTLVRKDNDAHGCGLMLLALTEAWAMKGTDDCSGAAAEGAPPRNSSAEPAALPYRFLLVINDQWKDPGSEVIHNVGEFSVVCALLKSWGLPFDIYRLDQQRFDAYHLLDESGRPLYGTIIWDAPGAKLERDQGALLRSFVADDGVGLIAFSDTVENPVIAELTGISSQGRYASADSLSFAGEHFITRGVGEAPDPPQLPSTLEADTKKAPKSDLIGGVDAAVDGATVIARRGAHPAMAVRRLPNGGKAVWFDAERSTDQIFHQRFRDLFKRSLVWANGYALYAEYPRSVMLSMDDMGASDKTYYPGWHYRTLSEDSIRQNIIEPLQRHHAVMIENVVTGYVDRRTHRILDPWKQTHVVDELDPTIIHDFSSTKRGLDDGQAAGVLEIQSHGWTHLSPDLDSPPGPFWSASPLGLVVAKNWYKEFGDYIRKSEEPAIVQRLHLQRGLELIQREFGVRAVSMICGGGLGSDSAANNTMRIAAKLGFGLAQTELTYYLGNDLCCPLEPVSPRLHWNYTQRVSGAQVPWTIDAPVFFGFHDRDVSMEAGSVARLLDDLGTVRYVTFGEYCAYLHAGVERDPSVSPAPALRVSYDGHYCDYFRTHASSWVLHLSDETRAALGPAAAERRTIRIPAGLGAHPVALR